MGAKPRSRQEQQLLYEELFLLIAYKPIGEGVYSTRGRQAHSHSANKHRAQIQALKEQGYKIRFRGRYVLEEVYDVEG